MVQALGLAGPRRPIAPFYLARMYCSVKKALMAVAFGLVLAPAPAQEAAKAAPRYDALLWRISGHGLAKPSYLYGTMHVSNKVAFHLSEEFFAALEQSDMVALEMDPASWLGELASSKWFNIFMSLSRGGQGSTDLYRDAFKLAVPDRRAIALALAQDPEVIDQLLYRLNAGDADHEEDTYLDLFIYQCGSRAGKPVLGLEPMEHSMLQLVKATAPDGSEPDPARMRRMREAYANGGNPLAAFEDSYRVQDLDRMDSLFDLTSADDRMRKYVIDERNTVFLEALEPMLAQRSVFVGVGAMHLPGRNGLIEMLRGKGYTVEPVRGDVTARSRAVQRKHEAAYHPVRWSTQWAADSAFSIELPAPLQVLPLGAGGAEVQVCADMVNASHFMVQRLPTYAALRGVSAAQVMAQVDSALYEGIPGRIERTIRFTTPQGWPGVEVRSVDRVGRVAHHRIVVSPFEIYIFERTMRDVGQAAKDGDRAFASIRFFPPRAAGDARWQPPAGGLQVALPELRHVRTTPTPVEISETARVQQAWTAQGVPADGHSAVLVMSTYFPDVRTIEQDTFELAVLAEQFGRSFGLSAVRVDKPAPAARSVRAEGLLRGGDTLRYLVALDGGRYDLLAARAPRAEAERYFGSYARAPYRPVAPRAYDDTLLHFSVRAASAQQDLWDQVSGFREYFQQVMRNATKKNRTHEREERDLIYRSPTTPEAVLVEFERFHRFRTVKDEDAFWDEQVKTLDTDGRLQVKERTMTGEREHRRLTLLLSDSASSRTVRVLMEQCPGALYTLRSIADEQGRLTAWADSFFTSFRPDTVFSEGLLVNKGRVLLDWLTGADSTRAEQARGSMMVARFDDADAPALIDYIRSAQARDKEKGRRITAIGKLGGLHHPAVIPFLKELYRAAGDTIELRMEVLEALAVQSTREGATAFMDLLEEDAPLTGDQWRIRSAFSPFHDSLPVARALFPRAWSLTHYPEYEDQVVVLAAALMERGLLSPGDLAARRTELFSKAKAALKRAIADARSGSSTNDDYDEDEGSALSTTRNIAWNTYLKLTPEDEVWKGLRDAKVTAFSPEFVAYHHLFWPFRTDAQVAAYFDQALRSGADDVELATAMLYLQKGAALPEGFWKRYLDRDEARVETYRTLMAFGRSELVDRSLLTPEKNALAYFVAGDRTFADDSIRLAGTRKGASRFGSGPVYFFRSKVADDEHHDEWHLTATGFFGPDDPEPFADKFILSAGENISGSEDIGKAMDDLITRLRYLGRKRWMAEQASYPPPPFDR